MLTLGSPPETLRLQSADRPKVPGMTRYVIDAPTLLHLVAAGVPVNPNTSLSRRASYAPKHSRCCSRRYVTTTACPRKWHFWVTSG